MEHPSIIQGGMGIGVSDWRLARAVSTQGAMGVVSGTALESVVARRLQQGDIGGHMRRGLAAFPDQDVAARILAAWFRPDGDGNTHDFKLVPLHTIEGGKDADELAVVSNFIEVYLAKDGHDGKIGVNFLEKIQLPNPASIYGAMLAGVDYILMGAGIPLEVPGLLDAYARGEGGELRINVVGADKDERYTLRFDPASILASPPPSLKRPAFLSIVSSYILAATMATRASGKVDGIIVENQSAGGHNAPPRGVLSLDDQGEPLYGPKDNIDYAKIVGIGLPFWLGGTYSMPESMGEAKKEGAFGIQVGTLFAFCRESGLVPELKKQFLKAVAAGKALVFTHPEASPTGYPFKIALLEGTLSDDAVFKVRKRVCNVGHLQELYKKPDGGVGYRCPAESEQAYISKGGTPERASQARCLCNALLANIGLGMSYAGARLEKPLLTVGKHLDSLKLLIQRFGLEYSATDVLRFLRSEADPS